MLLIDESNRHPALHKVAAVIIDLKSHSEHCSRGDSKYHADCTFLISLIVGLAIW